MRDQDEQNATKPTSKWAALWRDESGATSLEWTLLLAAIAIPSLLVIQIALNVLLGHYRMITTLNALPFP